MLLTGLFTLSVFSEVLTPDLFTKLFDALEFIQNDKVYMALIEILVLIGCENS
jgi:hypothetical protein